MRLQVSSTCQSTLTRWRDIYGAAEGTRTPDPIITNDVLYQLSYSGQPGVGVPHLRKIGRAVSTGRGARKVLFHLFRLW
jgi:hypothetical protein